MPQMAPLSWTLMYMMFIIVLIMFMVQNYFTKIDSLEIKNMTSNKLINNWKW